MDFNYRIIHISDLHFTKPRFPKDFWSKRILGYSSLNLLRRNLKHKWGLLQQSLHQQDWDLLLITGDITNLGQQTEFKQALQLLQPLLKKGKLLVLPGNHDRYTQETVRQDWIKKVFAEHCPLSVKNRPQQPFFIKELKQGLLLIGLDMAVPRPWFDATGHLPAGWQAGLLERLKPYQGWVKIAAGHYPLQKTLMLHELKKYPQVLDFLQQQAIKLYLHGHIHHSQSSQLQGVQLVNSAGINGYHRILVSPNHFKIEFCALEGD